MQDDLGKQMLFIDVLSFHMVRSMEGNTIISNHISSELRMTTAEMLHARCTNVCQSPAWQQIFLQSKDPTFVLLMMLWHAVSAWDMTLDALYEHFVSLVRSILQSTGNRFAQGIHSYLYSSASGGELGNTIDDAT
jgi:hypothetical protein